MLRLGVPERVPSARGERIAEPHLPITQRMLGVQLTGGAGARPCDQQSLALCAPTGGRGTLQVRLPAGGHTKRHLAPEQQELACRHRLHGEAIFRKVAGRTLLPAHISAGHAALLTLWAH